MTDMESTTVEASEPSGWSEPDYSDVPDHLVDGMKKEHEASKKKAEKSTDKSVKSSATTVKSTDTTSDKPSTSKEKDLSDKSVRQVSDKLDNNPTSEKKKLKIRGKEQEVEEEEYHAYAQKGLTATQDWQAAAKMKRDADERIQRIKDDPISVLQELGIDIDKIAEERIWDKIQKETDPEKYEAMKVQAEKDRKAKAYDEEQTKKLTSEQEVRKAENRRRFQEDFDKKIGATLASSGLPKTPRSAQRVVDYLEAAVREGYEPDIAEIAENVKQDLISDTRVFFDEAPAEIVVEMLGAKNVEKIRLHLLKKFKDTQTNSYAKPSTEPKPGRSNAPKKISGHDWLKDIKQGYLGKR